MKKIIMLLVMLSGLLLANDEVKTQSNLGINFLLNPNGINDVTINLNSSDLNNLTIKELGYIISKYNNDSNIGSINLEIGNTKFFNTIIDDETKESFSQHAHKVVYENDNKDKKFDKKFLDSILKNVKDEDERAEILKHLIIYSLLLIVLGALGMVLFLKISEEISEKMKNEGYSIYHYLLRYGLRFILLCIVVYIVFIFINEASTYLAK